MKFKIVWDNGASASGEFEHVFDTEAAAEAFGDNWRRDMCAQSGIDPDYDGEDTYTFEVVEIEEED